MEEETFQAEADSSVIAQDGSFELYRRIIQQATIPSGKVPYSSKLEYKGTTLYFNELSQQEYAAIKKEIKVNTRSGKDVQKEQKNLAAERIKLGNQLDELSEEEATQRDLLEARIEELDKSLEDVQDEQESLADAQIQMLCGILDRKAVAIEWKEGDGSDIRRTRAVLDSLASVEAKMELGRGIIQMSRLGMSELNTLKTR